MRTIAIGDIHGCLAALETLLDFVAPQPGDVLITLGDYVDRGPGSRGVIELLISLFHQGQLIPLRGNHDVMFCEARDNASLFANWQVLGGDATLRSYGGNLENVPATHWQFLQHDCANYYESATHIFVHAGVWPDVPLEEQPEVALHYTRFHNPAPHQSGKPVVCGHTAQRSGLPLDKGHAICIDTRAYSGLWLSALCVETGQLWQTNHHGATRQLQRGRDF